MDLERQSFSDIAESASNAVYELNSAVKRLHKLCSRSHAASGLSQVVSTVATKCTTTSQVIDALNRENSGSLSSTQKQQQMQISQEFSLIVKEIAGLQQKAGALLRKQAAAQAVADPSHASAASHNDAVNESTPLIQVLEELDQSSVNLHQQLIEERELEITQVQQGMNEINAIFSDLGTLIQEQGAQLDTVEDHVTEIASQTANAQRELVRADNYQKSRGKWSCYFLLALLALTILISLSFL